MKDDDPRFLLLARAISDGPCADWDAAEREALGESAALDDEERGAARALRLVHDIAVLHDSQRRPAAPAPSTRAASVPRDQDHLSDTRMLESLLPAPPVAARTADAPPATAVEPAMESRNPETPERWGHLEIREKLGAGAFGDVFRAWETTLEREVALKLLRPEALFVADAGGALATSVLQEGRNLARVRHPNVVAVYGTEQLDDHVGVWMEFVQGRTLEDLLKERGSFGAPEAALIGIDLCRALTAVHRASLVHRDIKSKNVMREEGGRIVLMDFGAGADLRRTQTRGPAGTPVYLAPEIFQGQMATPQSDLYSLGVLLYHLVTGSFPVQGTSLAEIRAIHERREATLLREVRPDLPDAFVRVVERALAVDLEERFASAGQMEHALTRALGLQSETESDLLESLRQTLDAAPAASPARPRRRRKKIESLAVLPFENLSRDPEQEYFADGMTDALIADLARIGALRVISRTSVMQYKGARKPLPEIARALNVDAVLEGTVLRSGGRVRITAELLEAATDRHLWAEVYERDLQDILTLQSEVARAIAQEIRIKLTPHEQVRLRKSRRIDPDAHEAYLKGRYYWNKRTEDGLKRALEHFNLAIEKDPRYAMAYAGLADAYAVLALSAATPLEAYPKAKAAAMRALEIDDTLSEAHASLAKVLEFEWDWAGAEREYSRAIELNPSSATARHWYSVYLTAMGRFDAAKAETQRAQELDPLSLIISYNRGLIYYCAREFDRAIEECKKTLEMEPNFYPAHYNMGLALEEKGDYEDAIAELQQAMKLSAGSTRMLAPLGFAYAVSGQRDAALQILAQLQDEATRRHVSSYQLAGIHAGLGEPDRAIAWLVRACDERDSWLISLKVDPMLDSLRPAPRFQDLLRRVGFPPD